MCNCGKKRNEYRQQPNVQATNTFVPIPVSNANNTNFEYTGKTALTVRGNITGKNYRFNHSGDIQAVDSRDVSGMMAVPVLKKV
jgi:hypothetical protein